MKTLIVVVEGISVRFIANEPNAYFNEDKILVINDQKINKKLGAFAKWDYWFYKEG